MSAYIITGATGYVGSMLIKHILRTEKKSKITVLVRDTEKAFSMFGNAVGIIETDLCRIPSDELKNICCDYIIHCASITKSQDMVTHPVEVIESIVNTTQNILNLAKSCHAKSVVYLSTMEVYGNLDCSDGHLADETDMGSVNLFDARSCYPLGKRMAENICFSYFKEYDIPVKIVRLAQTFGRGVLASDRRIFVQLAESVKNGSDIILHTPGNSVGNYCGIDDSVKGIMTVLQSGKNGEAYNLVNEANTMTIRQMAEMVAEKIANGNIKVVYDIPVENKYGYAADTGLRLSGKKLRTLGWTPTQTLEDMYKDILSEQTK